MATIVVGMFETPTQAHDAVEELFRHGHRPEDVSVIAQQGREPATGEPSRESPGEAGRWDTGNQRGWDIPGGSGPAMGMGAGAALGGLGGLLVGLGALAIPGIGPVVAAGPIATALAGAGLGAVGGALVGALVQLGIPQEDAQRYAEGVRRGRVLVAVRAEDAEADRVADVLDSHGALDVDERPAAVGVRRVRIYVVEHRRIA
ncbi:MAG TPA: hypothetical protein VNN07_17345 [Candidatus Tectomicrobia bacterium]|nr:hypothetical protein [Candidatus Tectomicrobia bacterium]